MFPKRNLFETLVLKFSGYSRGLRKVEFAPQRVKSYFFAHRIGKKSKCKDTNLIVALKMVTSRFEN
jgi:hypothetical protein